MIRNLVVVRAGDSSLHPDWLKNSADRTWDIIVNYYGENPTLYHEEGVKRIDSKGPKWPALYETLNGLGDLIDQYDYIWLPDDDLECDAASINKFFGICATLNLELAQPSLTLNSYFSHVLTLKNKAFQARFTNFVEIMAPCFSRSFLKKCLPSFKTNMSGWGLDHLWPTWITNPAKIAIIDSVSVRHTRPVGGPNYQAMKEKGISADDEMRALLAKENITPLIFSMKGGIDLEGNLHAIWDGTHKSLIRNILKGYLPEFAPYSDSLYALIDPILNHMILSARAPQQKQA